MNGRATRTYPAGCRGPIPHLPRRAQPRMGALATSRVSAASGGAEQPRKRPATKGKKDLMCICRKPSDPNRRWIGCSQCLEWFHPECLQITHTPPPQWTCPACQGGSSEASSGGGGRLADVPDASGVIIRRAFERPVSAVDSDLGEGDRYCICRRSYSAASTAAGPQQFLQCEYCAEWFHFECLGLSEQDVEAIDKWMCPRTLPPVCRLRLSRSLQNRFCPCAQAVRPWTRCCVGRRWRLR